MKKVPRARGYSKFLLALGTTKIALVNSQDLLARVLSTIGMRVRLLGTMEVILIVPIALRLH